MDGTLLQVWASDALLERIDGQDDPLPPLSGPGEDIASPKPGRMRAKGHFRGINLSIQTLRFGVDPDALLCPKFKAHPALPSYLGHVILEKPYAWIVDCRVTQAVGTGERECCPCHCGSYPVCPQEYPWVRHELRDQGHGR